MTIQRTTWAFFPPLLLAIAAIPMEIARAQTLDKSDFKNFEFEQSPALGFCPDLDAPSKATIVQQPDGSYVYTTSAFAEGNPIIDECLGSEHDFLIEGCIVIRDLTARVLSDAEVQRIKEAFSRVTISTGIFAENDIVDMFGQSIVCIDPCRIISVQWDDTRFNDGLAGCIEAGQSYSLISGNEKKEITQLLRELNQGGCQFDLCGMCLIPASLGIVAAMGGMRIHRRRRRRLKS